MRVLFTLLFLSLHFFAGAQNNPLPERNPEFKRFVFEANKAIKLRYYDSLYFDMQYENGAHWVFKFDYRSAESPAIADDEMSEEVIFQIAPPKGNSFEIKEEDFEKAMVVYGRSCFCKDSGPRLVKQGHISGKRIKKNRWLIEAELVIEPRPGTKADAYTKTYKGYYNPGKLIF